MPRPPVPIEQRQRAPRACGVCKASKRRCDSRLPCSACVKRNNVYACSYSEPVGRRRNVRHASKAEPRIASQYPEHHVAIDPSSQVEPADQAFAPSPTMLSQSSGAATREPDQETATPVRVPVLTRSRMLFNAKRERVFLGDAASLSFLQFLREILAQHLGPCTFPENGRTRVTPEEDILSELPETSEDVEYKKALLESYFAASNGLLDLYTKDELAALMAETNNATDIPTETTAALYIAIAIGGQCRASGPLDLKYAKKYFFLGQKVAFQGMVEDPSITLTRSFLLMAFYMLGACRRNAAFMYLGIAAKSAYALGLHVTEHYASTTENERHLHSSTWKSLRILDITVSTFLGRLSATPTLMVEPETFDTYQNETSSNRRICQDAIYRAATIMDDIFQGLLSSKSIDTTTAEDYLQKLNAWSSGLPSDLRRFTRASPIQQSDQELLIGNIHVAGIYYWTVMLITRPFLICTMSCSSKTAADPFPYEKQSYAEIKKLSQVCVSAAIYMAQMCRSALEPGSLLDNMCVLKGWIYSAGLVLGFSLVTSADIRYDVEEAFSGARDVLQKLSQSSPRTEHYYDVLHRLNEAITKYRQKLANESRKKHTSLVTELLTIEVNAPVYAGQQRTETPDHRDGHSHVYASTNDREQDVRVNGNELPNHHNGPHSDMDKSVASDTNAWAAYDHNLPGLPMAFGAGDTDDTEAAWDSFAMQISQSFPIDNGFGQLFDNP
ncbi:hypothetical protein BP5796_08861 [Coleophoma crateriformis]|uniref:Zn(2)-C6 fungal-type domain-containing protein n=1 Tax=Coleophoma crateriformis TaxID=565419 RepID=A0A3D8R315_9HELO|nr:hypothetical protein BP5796_08861 [Coleophoma crateriformis]